jgi:hypothetical protein
MNLKFRLVLCLVISGLLVGCANYTSPSGGKRDVTPPKLIAATPADSLFNTRVTRLEIGFDEYIVLADAQKEIQIAPLLPVPLTATGLNKHVVIKIVDSLLEENTTYRISFGKSIRDLHEGNIFPDYVYTFSTGSYFDSLQLKGQILDAATGMPDTANVAVMLYSASESDSAVIRRKPKYVVRPDNNGVFNFNGLPARNFRLYAVKDENNNLVYDGTGEMIAFNDFLVNPSDTGLTQLTLRLFAELPDSGSIADSLPPVKKGSKLRDKYKSEPDTNLTFTLNLDTANLAARTFDLTDSIRITFNRTPEFLIGKLKLQLDSNDGWVDLPATVRVDAARPNRVVVSARFKENAVYALTIADSFAVDTTGKFTTAARYKFRTFSDDDYGKIKLLLPAKYLSAGSGSEFGNAGNSSPDFLLLMLADADTVTVQKVTDTVINFRRLRPANYTFRIIVDNNKNGKWDTGDLLGKRQPEEVFPAAGQVLLKAGWEHNFDFDLKPKPKMGRGGLKDKSPTKK